MTQPFQEFENAWKQWRDQTIDSWSKMAQQVVESDSVSKSMAASYDWGLEMQRRMRENTQTFLQTVDVPTGEDLARLSRQMVSTEGRVLDCEEHIEALREQLAVAELAAREARTEAASLRARLDSLEKVVSAASRATTSTGDGAPEVPPEERSEKGNKPNQTRRRKS